jgi:hypothetical protein
LAYITLHADGQGPGGSYDWSAADSSIVRVIGSGPTATVSGLQTGITEVRVTYTLNGRRATDTIRCIAYNVAIEHPSGDPVNNGAATNEFTFSNATPGVLTIECRARVTPDDADARACAEPHLRWMISAVGASALAWDNPDPANAQRGQGLAATATFTGLPQNNSDFGLKTVTLLIEGVTAPPQTTNIEVFFPKNARNHPGPDQGRTPNWFYYWMQVVGNPGHVRYGGAGPGNLFGETRGMTRWSYAAVPNKRLVHVFDTASRRDAAIPGLHGPREGIDLFRITVRHETEHTRQIRRADRVVGVRPGTCWQNGWSWNVANHNHWGVGPDGQPGRAGVDDDGDGTVDNQRTDGPGEMGAAGSDDVLVESAVPGIARPTHWPTAWGAVPAGAAPAGGFIGGHPIEQQAFQKETGSRHEVARQDWGDPGKNHRTLNRWND